LYEVPFFYNAKIMLPLRKTFLEYGINVEWNGKERKIKIEYKEKIYEIFVDDDIIYFKDSNIKRQMKTIIKNSRTFISAENIMNILDGKVNYFKTNKKDIIVILESKNKVLKNEKLLYQLQDLDIDEVINSGFNIVIMDYSRDGTDENKYRKDEIEKLKNAGITTLAYISIGESENYRYYWDNKFSNSDFVGNENSDWNGNYKVKYWNKTWKKIIFNYIDKIIDAGYDGAYLDIVDAYEYWADEDIKEKNYKIKSIDETAKLMIEFISEISRYCKEKNPEFLIVPQNASSIINYDNGEYIANIDGIGVEDLWFMETKLRKQSDVKFRLENLKRIKNSGRFVFVIDYIYSKFENDKRIEIFTNNAKINGFKYYIADKNRNLDRILKIEK